MSIPEVDPELALNAHLFAGEQLAGAARSLALLLKMSSLRPEKVMEEHGNLVAGFAMLEHLAARAEENRCLMEAGIQALQEIAEGVDMLCTLGESATACQAEPETTFLLKGQQPEQMYDALKESFMHLHPDCSSEQHAAAMDYFARLVGL